ncbi:MAG: hypothetical protein AN484_28405, partial [Aphanizomenon flos-aquae WA102]
MTKPKEGAKAAGSAEQTAADMKSYIQELENKLKALNPAEEGRHGKPPTAKLPDFWSGDVALWFKQCEAVFANAGMVLE